MKHFILLSLLSSVALAQSSPTSTSQPSARPVFQSSTQPAAQAPPRKNQRLLIFAGVSGGLGLALGASAIGSARSASALLESQSPEADEIVRHRQKAIIRTSLSGVFFVASAAGLGVALLSPSEPVRLSFSLQDVSVQLAFSW